LRRGRLAGESPSLISISFGVDMAHPCSEHSGAGSHGPSSENFHSDPKAV
jgi:hypothetical protein